MRLPPEMEEVRDSAIGFGSGVIGGIITWAVILFALGILVLE